MNKRLLFKRIHLVCAFLSAIPIIAAGLTGTILVFYKPADYRVNKPHADVQPGNERFTLHELTQKVSRLHPELRWTGINIPKNADRAVQLWGTNPKDESWVVYVDPYRAQVTAAYPTDTLSKPTLIRWITTFHHSLQAGKIGARIVGLSTIVLILSALSGLILWMPKSLKSFMWKLRPRMAKNWRQNAYNWHAWLGFTFSGGLLVVAFTGMTMAFHKQIDPFIFWVTGTKPPTETPLVPLIKDRALLDPDAIVASATGFLQKTYPGHPWPEYISLPSDTSAKATVYFQESDDLYDLTLSEVVVNAQDGSIVDSSVPSRRNRGERVRDWVAVLHFGTWGDVGGFFWGWFGRILWVGIALMPLLLFVSGLALWLRNLNFSKKVPSLSQKIPQGKSGSHPRLAKKLSPHSGKTR